MSTSETVAEARDGRRILKVVIPAAEIKAQLDAKIEEVRPKINLKGFRPGKVPAAHIRKVYGPSMMQDVVNEALQKRAGEALDEAKVRPLGEPKLQIDSDMNAVMAGGADLAFQLEVDVMPEMTLPDPAGFTLERPITPVRDEEVEAALTKLAQANRVFEPRDGAAEAGDELTIDFIGRVDGEAFDGGTAQGATLVLGSGQFIPGFEDQLIGAAAGDVKMVNVTFPQDYPVDALQGKAAEFETTVQAVKAPQNAVIDEGLAERLGVSGVDELRRILREGMQRDRGDLSRIKVKRALFDQLDREVAFPLPGAMVDQEFTQIWSQVEAERQAGKGDPDDDGKSEEELRETYRRIAERRVRVGLVLAEYGNRNGVQVPNDAVNAAVMAQARRFPGREREVLEFYQSNPKAVAQLRAPLFEDRVVDFILELATVTDREVELSELEADDPMPE